MTTEEEKIKHFDIIKKIRQRIRGCFGSADGKFAEHQGDNDRAIELRNFAAESKISLEDVQDIVSGHLLRNEFPAEQIRDQFKIASDFFGEELK